MNIWNRTFWRATFERVASTALQAGVPLITVASLGEIQWGMAASVTGAAALLALVKALIAGLQNNGAGPGLGNAEVLSEPGQTGESSDVGPVTVEADPVPGIGERSPDFPVGKHSKDIDDSL